MNAATADATLVQHWANETKERNDQRAIDEAARFKVPPLGRDQVLYLWATDCVVDIECVLDYTPEEPAEPYGDSPYPGCPEDMTLCAAYVRGVDIIDLLSDDQIADIEEQALIARSER